VERISAMPGYFYFRRGPANLERTMVMLSHLSTHHGWACPGHPDYLASSLMIVVAGTSPAMTRFYVLVQNDRKPL
jgi:hypothetical protein